MTLTREQMNTYRQAAARRWEVQQRESEHRRRRAWQWARRAAVILKLEYGATRVVAFGSLAHAAWFHERSDIDLAAEGLKPGAVWRAWGEVEQLARGLRVDLIELETASERLRQRIREQGRDL